MPKSQSDEVGSEDSGSFHSRSPVSVQSPPPSPAPSHCNIENSRGFLDVTLALETAIMKLEAVELSTRVAEVQLHTPSITESAEMLSAPLAAHPHLSDSSKDSGVDVENIWSSANVTGDASTVESPEHVFKSSATYKTHSVIEADSPPPSFPCHSSTGRDDLLSAKRSELIRMLDESNCSTTEDNRVGETVFVNESMLPPLFQTQKQLHGFSTNCTYSLTNIWKPNPEGDHVYLSCLPDITRFSH